MKTLELLKGSVAQLRRMCVRTVLGAANGDFYAPALYVAVSVPLGLLTLAREICGGRM